MNKIVELFKQFVQQKAKASMVTLPGLNAKVAHDIAVTLCKEANRRSLKRGPHNFRTGNGDYLLSLKLDDESATSAS